MSYIYLPTNKTKYVSMVWYASVRRKVPGLMQLLFILITY